MSSDDLTINDPVTITSTKDKGNSDPLEGIIAHLGPVKFASGSDWIGIRLTGTSIRKGKNDGSVKGIAYFNAGRDADGNRIENNGMFVRRANVAKKVNLTRLEEIRLRREVEKDPVTAIGNIIAPPSSSSSAAAAAGQGSARRTSRSSLSSSSSMAAKSPAGTPSVDTKNRLAELKAKREALARGNKTPTNSSSRGSSLHTPPPSRTAASTPVTAKKSVPRDEQQQNTPSTRLLLGGADDDGNEEQSETDSTTSNNQSSPQPSNANNNNTHTTYRNELTRLQSKISTLQKALQEKSAENASLQSSLDFMSRGAEQSTHDAVRMYAMGALALSEAKKTPKGSITGGGGAVGRSGSGMTPGSGVSSGTARSLMSEMEDENEGGDDDDEEDSGSSDSDEEEHDDNIDKEQVVSQAAAAVSQELVRRNDDLTNQLSNLTSRNTTLQHQIDEAEERMSNLQQRYDSTIEKLQSEKQSRIDEMKHNTAEKSVMNSQISSLERELKVLQERVSDKESTMDHSHTTLAKLRAEVTSLQRKNEELTNDKLDMEATLEELVLDKEQLREEKEMLEDQLEECKIDLESAQLELDDAKCQLEEGGDVNVTIGSTDLDAGGEEGGGREGAADTQDVARSLTVQNTRLRTALLRLKEQSELERNDLQRQLKTYQMESSSKEEIQSELEELRQTHATTLEEMQELKDIIDETTSLEETIETLSDKVWNLEEMNANLERTIREMEESAEIAAEMEEVQSDELKMAMKDLEGRDALIRNLEEAIRMQRRREEDFQRYVSEFRTSISNLKQEKAALMTLTEGNQGEKSQLLAASKKALAQAAQLAVDAAEARKRDADAVFDRLTARSATYLSERLESFLPSGLVSAELAAVKGEMNLAKVADKASVSLGTVEEIFNQAIERGTAGLSEFNVVEEGSSAVLSDASTQQIAVMLHQSEFANIAVEAASDILRLMAAGQWPEFLSQDLSADLGSIMVHSMAPLDLSLTEQLKLLKEEGILSPLRSSLTDLNQSVLNAKVALQGATDESGKAVIPEDWNPPGWEALKSLSAGRFACLGAAAVISSAVLPIDDADSEPPAATLPRLSAALEKAKSSCTTILDVCKKLSTLKLEDGEVLDSLCSLSNQYRSKCSALMECIKTAFGDKTVSSNNVDACSSILDEILSLIGQLSALLRKVDLSASGQSTFHCLSPEFGDSWGGVTEIVAQVRAVDGDPEDINYLVRARAIEQQLADAITNEPKLLIATTKIASLDKSLSSRSKEISIQNARISELESLISKVPTNSMSPMKTSTTVATPIDTQEIKEEVRVLKEALSVMEQQAEEYENQIRLLKDKNPKARSRMRQSVTPKKSIDFEATIGQLGTGSKSAGTSSRDALLETISLETALFRPALTSVTQSATYWKAKAMESALSKLTPLNVATKTTSPVPSSINQKRDEWSHSADEMDLARNELRLAKATFGIVDLSKSNESARVQLSKERRKEMAAAARLHSVGRNFSGNFPSSHLPTAAKQSIGRIEVSCEDGGFIAPMTVNKTELLNFHSLLVS
eukprot:scaffold1004_cov120-Skeletonema_dohrnii-CCMP3373.AAC.2